MRFLLLCIAAVYGSQPLYVAFPIRVEADVSLRRRVDEVSRQTQHSTVIENYAAIMNLVEKARVLGQLYESDCHTRSECRVMRQSLYETFLNLRRACEVGVSQLLADTSTGDARNILLQNYTVMQEDCYRSIVLIPFWYGPIATAVFAFIFGGIVFLFCAAIFIAYFSGRFGWSQNSKPYLVVVGVRKSHTDELQRVV